MNENVEKGIKTAKYINTAVTAAAQEVTSASGAALGAGLNIQIMTGGRITASDTIRAADRIATIGPHSGVVLNAAVHGAAELNRSGSAEKAAVVGITNAGGIYVISRLLDPVVPALTRTTNSGLQNIVFRAVRSTAIGTAAATCIESTTHYTQLVSQGHRPISAALGATIGSLAGCATVAGGIATIGINPLGGAIIATGAIAGAPSVAAFTAVMAADAIDAMIDFADEYGAKTSKLLSDFFADLSRRLDKSEGRDISMQYMDEFFEASLRTHIELLSCEDLSFAQQALYFSILEQRFAQALKSQSEDSIIFSPKKLLEASGSAEASLAKELNTLSKNITEKASFKAFTGNLNIEMKKPFFIEALQKAGVSPTILFTPNILCAVAEEAAITDQATAVRDTVFLREAESILTKQRMASPLLLNCLNGSEVSLARIPDTAPVMRQIMQGIEQARTGLSTMNHWLDTKPEGMQLWSSSPSENLQNAGYLLSTAGRSLCLIGVNRHAAEKITKTGNGLICAASGLAMYSSAKTLLSILGGGAGIGLGILMTATTLFGDSDDEEDHFKEEVMHALNQLAMQLQKGFERIFQHLYFTTFQIDRLDKRIERVESLVVQAGGINYSRDFYFLLDQCAADIAEQGVCSTPEQRLKNIQALQTWIREGAYNVIVTRAIRLENDTAGHAAILQNHDFDALQMLDYVAGLIRNVVPDFCINTGFAASYNSAYEEITAPDRYGCFIREDGTINEILKESVIRSIPETYKVSEAIGKGDCFFDTMAQCLNEKEQCTVYNAKSLRLLCHEYVLQEHPWVQKAVEQDGENYDQYRARLQFTADEMEQHNRDKTLTGAATWGRPDIEGRIICKLKGIQLHVIEARERTEEDGLPPIIHQLIDAERSKSVDTIDFDDPSIVHVLTCRNHTVPVLNANKVLKTQKLQHINKTLQVRLPNVRIFLKATTTYLLMLQKYHPEAKVQPVLEDLKQRWQEIIDFIEALKNPALHENLFRQYAAYRRQAGQCIANARGTFSGSADKALIEVLTPPKKGELLQLLDPMEVRRRLLEVICDLTGDSVLKTRIKTLKSKEEILTRPRSFYDGLNAEALRVVGEPLALQTALDDGADINTVDNSGGGGWGALINYVTMRHGFKKEQGKQRGVDALKALCRFSNLYQRTLYERYTGESGHWGGGWPIRTRPITMILNCRHYEQAILYCAWGVDISEYCNGQWSGDFGNGIVWARQGDKECIFQLALVHDMNQETGLLNKNTLRIAYQYYCAVEDANQAKILELHDQVNPTVLLWIIALLGDWTAFTILNKPVTPDEVNRDIQSYTPLMLASELGRGAVIKELIKLGASFETKRYDGKNAVQVAIEQQQWAVADLLAKQGCACSEAEQQQILDHMLAMVTITPEPLQITPPQSPLLAFIHQQVLPEISRISHEVSIWLPPPTSVPTSFPISTAEITELRQELREVKAQNNLLLIQQGIMADQLTELTRLVHLLLANQIANSATSTNKEESFYLRLRNAFEQWDIQKAKELSLTDKKVVNSVEAMQKQAQNFGYRCMDVKRDGRCFYYAFIRQLHKINLERYQAIQVDKEGVLQVIQRVAQHIIENQERYEAVLKAEHNTDLNGFIDTMLNNTGNLWADNIIILAAGRAFNLNIAIVHNDRDRPTIFRRRDAEGTVYLGHEVEIHYQSLEYDPTIEAKEDLNQYIERGDFDEWRREAVDERRVAEIPTARAPEGAVVFMPPPTPAAAKGAVAKKGAAPVAAGAR